MKLVADRIILALLSCVMLAFGATSSFAQGDTYKDAFYWNKQLNPGINLDNALVMRDGKLRAIEENHLALIASAGFKSVRIPVVWSTYTGSNAPYTIKPAFFERVDKIVNEALANNLIPIINIHHYTAVMKDPAGQEKRFLRMWEQISQHYANYSPKLMFEILNEPSQNLNGEVWNSMLNKAIRVVRKTNPERILFVGPGYYNSYTKLSAIELPRGDHNLIMSLHYYDPMNFTHQGAAWMGDISESWLGTTWRATEYQRNRVIGHFDIVAEWAENNDVPIHIGEFGAYDKADMTSRVKWTRFIREQAEKRGWSWAYWEFCYGYGIYDRHTDEWRTDLLDALLH